MSLVYINNTASYETSGKYLETCPDCVLWMEATVRKPLTMDDEAVSTHFLKLCLLCFIIKSSKDRETWCFPTGSLQEAGRVFQHYIRFLLSRYYKWDPLFFSLCTYQCKRQHSAFNQAWFPSCSRPVSWREEGCCRCEDCGTVEKTHVVTCVLS